MMPTTTGTDRKKSDTVQVYFDQIMAGTKKQEYREAKPTTIKRLLYILVLIDGKNAVADFT